LPCRVDNQCQLPALVVFGDRIAGNGTGKSALRADGEPVEIDVTGCFVDAAFERIEAFQHRRLRADHAQHHALVLRYETQRRKIAGARRVKFEQEVIHLRIREKALGDRLVAAGAEIVALEVAAAHMHADRDVRRAFGDGVVDALDVQIDENARLAARALDLVADGGIAQKRDGDLIELHIPAAGLGEPGDLLPEHCRKIGEK
jgi:hypothetical protein